MPDRIGGIYRCYSKVKFNVSDQKGGISYGISTESKELLPASVMTTLTPGRFAGKIADTFEHPIDQKLIYGDVYLEDMAEDMIYTSIPKINKDSSTVFAEKVDARYREIISDIEGILRVEGL